MCNSGASVQQAGEKKHKGYSRNRMAIMKYDVFVIKELKNQEGCIIIYGI
ncbi:hypothetical protein CHK_2197 [Christensenella hongkongensis]|uniref:Uncharacterized protein n=1 Tax=Christensenella hongkongensis TaxID=270498 RepID=A0A0M2NCB7_9FIRM|nr:hypothetical protein CHK_2197 [Christensenella hongkongensis]